MAYPASFAPRKWRVIHIDDEASPVDVTRAALKRPIFAIRTDKRGGRPGSLKILTQVLACAAALRSVGNEFASNACI
jgi:hypothetical protein